MRNEVTIFTDVINIVNQGLTSLNFQGWTVKQGGQPIIDHLTRPTILVDLISAPRYGWQHRENQVNDNIVHHEYLYQDLIFQLTAFKRRTDYANEVSSIDVISGLAMWLNSQDGISYIKNKGYGILKIREIRTGFFVNEEESYERCPSLDFCLNFRQELTTNAQEVAAIDGEVRGV